MDADTTTGERSASLVVAAVAVSVTLTAVHGVAHASIPVLLRDWQTVYVASVLFGLPVLGGAVAVRGRVRTGSWIAFAGGLGALAFESLAHFAVHNPDHVATVESGLALFAGTAGLSVVGDALLVVAAGWVLRGQTHGSSTSSRSESTT